MAAAHCAVFGALANGGGMARRALQAASRYDKRVAVEASLSSELPAPGAFSQRRNLLLPADQRVGKKGGKRGEGGRPGPARAHDILLFVLVFQDVLDDDQRLILSPCICGRDR